MMILGKIVHQDGDESRKKIEFLAKVSEGRLKPTSGYRNLKMGFKSEVGEIRFVRLKGDVYSAKDIQIPTIIIDTRNDIKRVLADLRYENTFSLKNVRWLIGRYQNSIFSGVLLTNQDIKKTQAGFALNEGVVSLESYSITHDETIRILVDEDMMTFVSRLELPPSEGVYMPFSWEETFTKALAKIFSRKELMKIGVKTKESRRVIQTFINNLDRTLVVDYLANKLGVSTSEIMQKFEEFLRNKQDELDYKDADSQLIIEIAKNSDLLRKRINSEIEKEWEQENKEKIAKNSEELEALRKKRDDIESITKIKQEQLAEIRKEVAIKTKLSESLEQRLQTAKEDISDFRAQYLLLNGDSNNQPANSEEKSLVGYSAGEEISLNKKSVKVANGTKLIEKLADEFVANGIADDDNALILAGSLYASLQSKKPLLLIGPMGIEAINILSACLYKQVADELDCSVDYNSTLLESIKKSKNKMLVVKGFFGSDWTSKIGEILTTDKAAFFVHPYKEELIMEARSIYYYLTPLLMDLVVENIVSVNYAQLTNLKRSSTYKDIKVASSFIEDNLELSLHPIMKKNLQLLTEIEFSENEELLQKLELSLAYLTENNEFLDAVDGMDLLKGIWYE